MKKSEFDALIQAEVAKQLKAVIPKMVKPLVQEAVAGALASLLAEGITKGPPVTAPKLSNVLTPDIPQARQPAPRKVAARTDENVEAVRERLRSRIRSVQEMPDSIGLDATQFGGGIVGGILAETASAMANGPDVESVLDYGDELPVDGETVNAITRDYSALMKRMKQMGKLNG
jgi:hypothetical protein